MWPFFPMFFFSFWCVAVVGLFAWPFIIIGAATNCYVFVSLSLSPPSVSVCVSIDMRSFIHRVSISIESNSTHNWSKISCHSNVKMLEIAEIVSHQWISNQINDARFCMRVRVRWHYFNEHFWNSPLPLIYREKKRVFDAVSSDFILSIFQTKKQATEKATAREKEEKKFPNKVVQGMRDKRLSSKAMLAEHLHKWNARMCALPFKLKFTIQRKRE